MPEGGEGADPAAEANLAEEEHPPKQLSDAGGEPGNDDDPENNSAVEQDEDSSSSGSSSSGSSSSKESSSSGSTSETGDNKSSTSGATGTASLQQTPHPQLGQQEEGSVESSCEEDDAGKLLLDFHDLIAKIPRPSELLDLYSRVFMDHGEKSSSAGQFESGLETVYEDYVKFLVMRLELSSSASINIGVESEADWIIPKQAVEDLWRLHLSFGQGAYKEFVEFVALAYLDAEPAQEARRKDDEGPASGSGPSGLGMDTNLLPLGGTNPGAESVAASSGKGDAVSGGGSVEVVSGEGGSSAGGSKKAGSRGAEAASGKSKSGSEAEKGEAMANAEAGEQEGADVASKEQAQEEEKSAIKGEDDDAPGEGAPAENKTEDAAAEDAATKNADVDGDLIFTKKKQSAISGPPSRKGELKETLKNSLPLDLTALKEALLAKDPDRLTVDELLIQIKVRLGDLAEESAPPTPPLADGTDQEPLSVDAEIRRMREVLGSKEQELLELEELANLRAEVAEEREVQEKREDLRDAMRALIEAQMAALERVRTLTSGGGGRFHSGANISSSSSSSASMHNNSSHPSTARGMSSVRTSGRSSFILPDGGPERRLFGGEDLRLRKKRLRKHLFGAGDGSNLKAEVVPQPPVEQSSIAEIHRARAVGRSSAQLVEQKVAPTRAQQEERTKALYTELFADACFWFPPSSTSTSRSQGGGVRAAGGAAAALPTTAVLSSVSVPPPCGSPSRSGGAAVVSKVDFSVSPEERDELARRYLLSIEPLSKTRKIIYVPFRDVMEGGSTSSWGESQSPASRRKKPGQQEGSYQHPKMAVFSDTTVADLREGLFYVYRDRFLGRQFEVFSSSSGGAVWEESRTVGSYVPVDTFPELLLAGAGGEGHGPAEVTVAGTVFQADPVQIFFTDSSAPFFITVEVPIPDLAEHGTRTTQRSGRFGKDKSRVGAKWLSHDQVCGARWESCSRQHVGRKVSPRLDFFFLDGRQLASPETDGRTLRELRVTPRSSAAFVRILSRPALQTSEDRILERLGVNLKANAEENRESWREHSRKHRISLRIASALFPPGTVVEAVEISPLATVYEVLLLFEEKTRTAAQNLTLEFGDGSGVELPLTAYLGDLLGENPPKLLLKIRF
eukprot:g4554.t1